jgi:hypothetical protein
MELIRGLQAVEQELRLPLTQPILPASELPADTKGSDTISIPRVRGGEDTLSRGSGPGPGGARSPGGSPAGSRPAEASDNATLRHDPIRVDPRGPAAGAHPQTVTAQRPLGPGAWGNSPVPRAARERVFPREAPEGATMARPQPNAPGGAASSGTTDAGFPDRAGGDPGRMAAAGPFAAVDPGQRKTGRGRVLALVGGGAALAVAAGVAVVALSHGSAQPGSTPATAGLATQPGGAQNAIGEGAAAPGTPAVKATRLSATKVEFSWTYDNSASGDTFQWTVSGTVGSSSGQATQPDHTVTVPSGKVACFEVRVTSAQGEASGDSQPVCWPQ